MSVTIEKPFWLLRGGPSHSQHGDPYSFCCTIIIRDAVAEVIGLAGEISTKEFYQIKEKLKSEGIKKIIWDRYENGKCDRRTLDI